MRPPRSGRRANPTLVPRERTSPVGEWPLASAQRAHANSLHQTAGIHVSESHQSVSDLRVLHTLRCIGVSSEERVASASGLAARDTTDRLHRLADRGLAELGPGPFGGWGLTEDGRVKVQKLVGVELDLTDSRANVRRCYESFLGFNPKLLQVCTDWQMRTLGQSHILNDHLDPDYDAKVLTRLMRIDDASQQICADLAGRLARFGVYGPRLSRALERVLAGEHAYVADTFESYHTVWFQLHEDLLVTLGISRDDETRGTEASG